MPPNRLGYDRDGHDFEAVQPSDMRQVAKAIDAIGEGDKREGRRHRKAKPCRQSAREAGTQHAEDNADLAARGAGQKLAERDDVAVDRFIQLFAALDEFGAEIAKMRKRCFDPTCFERLATTIIGAMGAPTHVDFRA